MGMRLEPSTYAPCILFGPRRGQLIKLDGREFIRVKHDRERGIYYPVALLREAAHLFQGVKLRTNHGDYPQKLYDRPVTIGRVRSAEWNAKRREIRGILEIKAPPYRRVVEAGGCPGLSPCFRNIRSGPLVEEILRVDFVDIVEQPYSAARILPITEALAARNFAERLRCAEYNGDTKALAELARIAPAVKRERIDATVTRPRGALRLAEHGNR